MEAVQSYDGVLNEAHVAGLFFDLGRRALARSVAQEGGASGFVEELFAETVAYYASRDLPSFLGKRGRIAKASDLIALKQQLQQHARQVASSKGLPRLDKLSWKRFVTEVVKALSSKRTE